MPLRVTILPNWLGDLVMASPAIEHFARRGEHLVVGSRPLVELALDVGLSREGEVYDRRGADRGWAGLWRAARRLTASGADDVLVLGPSLRAAALAALSGAGIRRGVGGEGREALLTHVHRVPGGLQARHLARTWYEVAGGHGDPPLPRWRPGPRGLDGLRALTEPDLVGTPFAAYAPGATYGPTKQWPAASFARLAREVERRWGLRPVFVGGAAERELTGPLAERTGGIDLAGRTDLPTLVAVLARAGLFVGNDSGPMHVAAAVGTPTVGVFGSTSPVWTAPRGPWVRVAGPAPVACSPCFRSDCPFALECLVDLSWESVFDAVRGMIDAMEVRA